MKSLEFENRVKDTIKRYNLLQPGDNVIIGVSGGPDSVAMLYALAELNKRTEWGCRLQVAHVNHMLRGQESQDDEHFVRDLAGLLGLEFTVKKVDVREFSSREKCSIETAARRLRYAFFEELAEKASATRVAVGHTADDNAETLLHRIIRGTGLLGLGGIRPSRRLSPTSNAILIRPLLHIWRRDVFSYIEEKGLKYRIDSSNLRPENLRNRIRLELLPLLEDRYNPQIKDALTKLGDVLGRSNDFLQSRISKMVEANLKQVEPGAYSFEADLLRHHPPFFQHFFLKEVFSRIDLPLKKMDHGHYNRVVEMVEGVTACKQVELPEKWTACLEGNMLCFRRAATQPRTRAASFEPFMPLKLNIPGATELPDGRKLRAEILSMENGLLDKFKDEKTPEEEILDADKAGERLHIRTRRDGDRFRPLGVDGEKKLKDFFIDTKTPRWERNNVLLVATDAHPVWVVGLRIDERVKITPDTRRVLKLSVR